MKNLFLAMLVLIHCFPSSCQITWCPPGATWHNPYASQDGYEGYVETKYVSDTVISGINCKKLLEKSVVKHYNSSLTGVGYKEKYTYESGNVVYMYNLIEESNNWDTLYNFNIPVDSVWHLNATNSAYVKVNAVGVKVINNDTLQWRAINYFLPFFQAYFSDTLYERLGVVKSFGFQSPWVSIDFAEPRIHGLCNYSDSTFPVFGWADSICTKIYTSVIDGHEPIKAISIFPNPVNKEVTFELSDDLPALVTIYDVLSHTIIKETFTRSITINTGYLETGIYFYEVKTKGRNVYYGKIARQ